MKKTVAAAALMALLVGLSGWNIRHLDALTGRLDGEIRRSRACWDAGDGREAVSVLQDALEDWQAQRGYTYIFLRHTEIDALTDDFYTVLSALDGNGDGVGAAYDRLEARLRELDEMEHVTVGTVF